MVIGKLGTTASSAPSTNGNKVASAPPVPSIYSYDQAIIKARPVDRVIHPILHSRRSAYKMTGKPIDDETLLALFEAARWSPSCYNLQNWRFVYAKRDTEQWPAFLSTLMDLNTAWAKEASAIIVALSKKSFIFHGNVAPQAWASFDTGAAWMALALEGSARGLVTHCMGGYFKDKVEQVIGLEGKDDFQVEAVIAVGYPAPESAAEPVSQRLPLETFVAEGKFSDNFNHTESR